MTLQGFPEIRVTLQGSPETRVTLQGSPEARVTLRGPQPGGSPGSEGTREALQALRGCSSRVPGVCRRCAGCLVLPVPSCSLGQVRARTGSRGGTERGAGPCPGRGHCAPTPRRRRAMSGGGDWGCRSGAGWETQHSRRRWRASTAPGGSAGQGRRRARG